MHSKLVLGLLHQPLACSVVVLSSVVHRLSLNDMHIAGLIVSAVQKAC
jgi:phosphosulfolactate phosphohydrolase-like enzyme